MTLLRPSTRSGLRWTGRGSIDFYIFSFINTNGDDRFRQCDSKVRSFLFGMASVPVTHMMHPIDAKTGILAMAREIAGKVRLPQLVPVLA